MPNKIQFRRGTAAEWAFVNPILRAGEPGYETDTGKYKIGDGASLWGSLEYAYGPSLEGAPNGVATLDSGAKIPLSQIPVSIQTANGARPVGRGEHQVSVTDFGADTAGVSDSTAAIQAAIDSLATKGGTVWFPVGTYKVSGIVYMKKAGVSLAGAGPTLVFASGAYISIGDTVARTYFKSKITGLRFFRATYVSTDSFIGYLRARDVLVQNCNFDGAGRAITAIANSNVASHDNSTWTIDNNWFANVDYAWYVDKHASSDWGATADSHFNNNTVNLAYVTGVYCVAIDGLHVQNNTFFSVNYASANARKSEKVNNIYSGRNGWVVITGNNLFEAGLESIKLVDCSSAVNIVSNNIAWPGQKAMANGIDVATFAGTGYKSEVNIIGNIISKYTKNAVNVSGAMESLRVENVVSYDPTTPTYFGTPRVTAIVTSTTIPVDNTSSFAVNDFVDIITVPSTVTVSNRQITAKTATSLTLSGAAITTTIKDVAIPSEMMVVVPTGTSYPLTATATTHYRTYLDDSIGNGLNPILGAGSNRAGEQDRLPNAGNTISQRVFGRFYVECTTKEILLGFVIEGTGAVLNLKDALRSVSNYDGEILITAKRGLNSNDRAASYLLHVAKSGVGGEVTLLSSLANDAGANVDHGDPSFTFTVNTTNNQLVATSVGQTSGSFYFFATSRGNLIIS